MRANRPRCMANTHQEEGSNRPDGGWTINRNDRGNWTGGAVGVGILAGTKWGIAANSAKRFGIDPLSIRTMTRAEADAIYTKYYWNDAWGDDWPMGFDQLTYDATVNSGAGRGPLWTCQALGFVRADRAAITKARMLDTNGRIAACKKTAAVRMSFLQGIKGPSGWQTFGRGWGGRVQRMEAIAVKMCLEEGKVAPAEQTKRLEKESGAAKSTSNKAGAGAAGGATAGGGGATKVGTPADPIDWIIAGGVTLAVIGAVGACIWIWFKHRERAKAYLQVARGMIGAN